MAGHALGVLVACHLFIWCDVIYSFAVNLFIWCCTILSFAFTVFI